MTENWRPVVGYKGLYEVSDLGAVRSMPRHVVSGEGLRYIPGGLLTARIRERDGYPQVTLSRKGRSSARKVHRLVAEAWVQGQAAGLEVRHRNGIPTDTRASNLTWGTHAQNVADSVEHGTHWNAARTHCPAGHEYNPSNTYRGGKGGRQCKICTDTKTRARRERSRIESEVTAKQIVEEDGHGWDD